jgi:hypothetical protein
MVNTFTGKDFVKQLSADALKQPLEKIGIVKKHDQDTSAILFSEGSACGRWTMIPVDIIEEVTVLGHVTCRDHEHPLVKIVFKEPPADDKVARAFADLLRQGRTPAGPAVGGTPTGGDGAAIARRAGGGGLGTGGSTNLKCIVWHEECSWKTLYIPSLGINIPFYVCEKVCDTYEP